MYIHQLRLAGARETVGDARQGPATVQQGGHIRPDLIWRGSTRHRQQPSNCNCPLWAPSEARWCLIILQPLRPRYQNYDQTWPQTQYSSFSFPLTRNAMYFPSRYTARAEPKQFTESPDSPVTALAGSVILCERNADQHGVHDHIFPKNADGAAPVWRLEARCSPGMGRAKRELQARR